MNKKANRRALFICLFVCFLYGALIFKLPERVSARRIVDTPQTKPNTMSISLPEASLGSINTTNKEQTNEKVMEPSFLVSVPIVCAAIKDRRLEKEGLIFIKKSGYNTANCKKPLDILKDKDEEGLKSILKIIGTQYPYGLLKREGISYSKELSAEDIMLGRGFVINKNKLLSLYSTYVTDECSSLIPYYDKGIAIQQGKGGLKMTAGNTALTKMSGKETPEWIMPNLINLSLRTAIEKITVHTPHVKVYGSGYVVEQHPRPFERIKGEPECVIYGRTDTQ